MIALRGLISSQLSQAPRVPGVERVQHERRQREVVDAVDMLGDFDLLAIVTMDLHQDFDSTCSRLFGQLPDKRKRFGNHEARGPRFLDGVAGGIQADRANACRLKLIQNLLQIAFARGIANVDIDLLRRECRPQQALGSILKPQPGKRQGWARPINLEQVRFPRTVRKHAVVRQEHSRIGGRVPVLLKIGKLRGLARHMVDDQIGHDVDVLRHGAHVVPGA